MILEKYKGQTETKFSASYHEIRIAIGFIKQFRTEDTKYVVECLNEEFERFSMSRLKLISISGIKSGCITSDFPFSVAFVYSKSNNNESRQIVLGKSVVNLRY